MKLGSLTLWPPPPSCSCGKSVCWIGCCLLLPHLLFSSNSWRRWNCNDKTLQKPPQQLWQDWNVGAYATPLDFAVQPPWRWRWQHVGNLLEFLTAARLWWWDCTATSSMTGARLLYWRISNHLQFDGATSLTMAMAARRKSSQILDNSNTAMSAHRQPPWQRWRATHWRTLWFNIVCGLVVGSWPVGRGTCRWGEFQNLVLELKKWKGPIFLVRGSGI